MSKKEITVKVMTPLTKEKANEMIVNLNKYLNEIYNRKDKKEVKV